MTVMELARKYYPRLWDEGRLQALVERGRLSEEELRELKAGAQKDREG